MSKGPPDGSGAPRPQQPTAAGPEVTGSAPPEQTTPGGAPAEACLRLPWWQAGLLVVLVAAAAGALWYWWEPIWQFFGDQRRIREWIAGFGPWAPLVSIALQAAQVLLAPIPGQIFNVVNGYLYHVWLGTLYSVIGMLLGITAAIALGRRFGRPLVERLVKPATLARWDRLVERQGVLFFFLVFLLPGLPDGIFYIVGLSNLPMLRLVVLGVLGRLPGIFISCWVGAYAIQLPLWVWIPLGTVVAGLAWLFWRYQARLQGWALAAIRSVTGRRT